MVRTPAPPPFSHTASLTGSHIAYEAAFKQVGFIIAHDFDDMLDYAKIFDTQALSTGDRIAVITNGGGAGVLTTDAIYLNNMQLAELSKKAAVSFGLISFFNGNSLI